MSFASLVASLSPYLWWRLGEAPGATTAADSGSGGNPGTYYGPPTLGVAGLLHDGDADTSMSVVPSSQRVSNTFSDFSTNQGSFSVFIRLKPSSLTGTGDVIMRRNGTATNIGWMIRRDTTDLVFYRFPNYSGHTMTFGTLTVNTEYSAGLTYDANTGETKAYLNGALVGTTTQASIAFASQFAVGAATTNAEGFTGTLDEAIYWSNVVLTPTNMSDLHTAATTAGNAASGTASLNLSASGTPTATSSGTASLSLSASGSTSAPASGTASLNLSATGSVTPPAAAAGTASLNLSATGDVAASPAGTASLSLLATASAEAVLAASGTATLNLSASGSADLSAAGTAYLNLSAVGEAIAVSTTDTSNALNGRTRGAYATVTATGPVVAVPPKVSLGVRYDKAIAYPTPTLVDGRPT